VTALWLPKPNRWTSAVANRLDPDEIGGGQTAGRWYRRRISDAEHEGVIMAIRLREISVLLALALLVIAQPGMAGATDERPIDPNSRTVCGEREVWVEGHFAPSSTNPGLYEYVPGHYEMQGYCKTFPSSQQRTTDCVPVLGAEGRLIAWICP